MTTETKETLRKSINEFLVATSDEKDSMVSFIQNKINEHYNALNSIGVGYREDMVRAGEIFLRIYSNNN